MLSHSVVSNSLWPHGLWPASSAVHGDSPGKKTGEGCHFHLQGNLPIQGSGPGLLHCRQILYCLSHQGGPIALASPGASHSCSIKRSYDIDFIMNGHFQALTPEWLPTLFASSLDQSRHAQGLHLRQEQPRGQDALCVRKHSSSTCLQSNF